MLLRSKIILESDVYVISRICSCIRIQCLSVKQKNNKLGVDAARGRLFSPSRTDDLRLPNLHYIRRQRPQYRVSSKPIFSEIYLTRKQLVHILECNIIHSNFSPIATRLRIVSLDLFKIQVLETRSVQRIIKRHVENSRPKPLLINNTQNKFSKFPLNRTQVTSICRALQTRWQW